VTDTASIRERLARAPPVPPAVLDTLASLHAAGHAAYLAGGGVRDLLLGRTPGDWDIATSARPDAVQRLFRRVIPIGLQHGTVSVLIPGGAVEVTTFRGEGAYLDGRRPESVQFLDDVHDDLARRDFTINALAWDPLHHEVRDPFGGAVDLERRVVRAVGNPVDRFTEDGLRCLRAVRFASVLGFTLDPATESAIPAALDTFRKVASERVRDELLKLLLHSPVPSRGMTLLADTGLLAAIVPELLEGRGFVQNRWHQWDVWTHTLQVLDSSVPRLVVRLAALLHDVAKPRCAVETAPGEHTFHRHELVGADVSKAVLERLRLPRKVIDDVVHLVQEHNWTYDPAWNDGTVRRHLARLGVDALDDFFGLREADLRGRGRHVDEGLANLAELRTRFQRAIDASHALTIKDLALTGTELMKALDTSPGPHVGVILRALLQHVLDHPEDNTPARLLELARGHR
jgi:tRNA nucleotidyltransferase (CCA-adding enzyme)